MGSIFEIFPNNLETGMRGYPVGYCTTSKVDPYEGLFYKGIPILELTNYSPEEVICLLSKGYLPSKEELNLFSQKLLEKSEVSPQVIQQIRQLPRGAHPMELFSTALMLLGMYESTGDYEEDALNVIAKLPQITAEVINHHAGWETVSFSQPELGYIENFTHMLNCPNKDTEGLNRVLKTFHILHVDHGGGNLSTFVGKAVSSSLEDMYGSLSSAMNALAGPLHGRANQSCLEMVKEICSILGENLSESSIEDVLRNKMRNKELIYGFGHAVLRIEDPRASIQYALAEELYPDHPFVKCALLLRKTAPRILKENPRIQNPYPNVDAISGSLLTAAGFPFHEYYTVLFGMARCVGIALQIVYERCLAREGRGVPIYRPKYIYSEFPLKV